MTNESPNSRRQIIQSIDTAPEMPGRRAFFSYRDLGITAASGGALGAKTMHMKAAMAEPTGWHYHECDAQFSYILKGWADLVFEDGTEVRVKAGDVLFIPGGLLHNEIATSDDVEALEFTIPAQMGTVAVDAPAWWTERLSERAAAA